MKIIEVVEKVKKYHKGSVNGQPIDETKTRDKILYGDASQECTGIVTTCYASSDVIKAAHERGANLVIVHEALFWNHGDHQEWLADNKVFQAKKKLLDDTKIVVWRDHDYIHSGIPLADGSYIDGIFYGLMKVLDWQEYLVGEGFRPMTFSFPQRTVASIAQELIEKTNLNGLRITGDPKTIVGKLKVVSHIIGQADNDMLKMIESEDIDAIITLEITDYTVSEYIRDSAMLGRPRAAINMGHFNTEEPGMEYMIEYLPQIVGDIPVSYVQSGDAYNFIVK
jgi:putative NIF3 family GTP cyclohydrolase 1 type 2